MSITSYINIVRDGDEICVPVVGQFNVHWNADPMMRDVELTDIECDYDLTKEEELLAEKALMEDFH